MAAFATSGDVLLGANQLIFNAMFIVQATGIVRPGMAAFATSGNVLLGP